MNDNSINQEVNETMLDEVENNNQLHQQDYTYKPVFIPKDPSLLNSSFANFFSQNTKAIFASGFLFKDAIENYASQLKDEFIIFIDDGQMDFVNNENPFISSIAIMEVFSGFLAGFLSSIYLTTYYYEAPENWKLGLWGAFPFPSIISFMSGFEEGMNYFKIVFKNKIPQIEQLELVSPFNGNSQEIKWYTNSFEADGSGEVATGNLINKGAKIIYPIAGFQTKEALQYITKFNFDIKVIGVDIDISLTYPEYQDLILFSTVKNFKEGISEDIQCFYSEDDDAGISDCLKSQEVYGSELIFPNNDYSFFDSIVEDFFQFYFNYNIDPTFDSTSKIISLLMRSDEYQTLSEKDNSSTFSSESNS